eukprot:1179371-Prorocentrum_minimum.AAC.3
MCPNVPEYWRVVPDGVVQELQVSLLSEEPSRGSTEYSGLTTNRVAKVYQRLQRPAWLRALNMLVFARIAANSWRATSDIAAPPPKNSSYIRETMNTSANFGICSSRQRSSKPFFTQESSCMMPAGDV